MDSQLSDNNIQQDQLLKCCVQGYIKYGKTVGEEIQLCGINTYYTKGTDNSKASILYLHDAFGWTFPNNRLLCDSFAEQTGFNVYMPDFFDGQTIMNEEKQAIFDRKTNNCCESISKGCTMIGMFYKIKKIYKQFNGEVSIVKLEKIINELSSKGKVGTTGYCWGGKYSLISGSIKGVQACVANHPSGLELPQDITNISTPTLLNCADNDFLFSDKMIKQTEDVLQNNQVQYEIIHYPGVRHGFASRGNEQDEIIAKAKQDCFLKGVEWFKKYLA